MTPTQRQSECLRSIKAFTRKNGYPPTVRDIGRIMGIRSPNGVRCHLDALENKGLIDRDGKAARGIRVVEAPTTCPHCGKGL